MRRAACGVRQLAQAQHLPCLVCCGWELAQLEGTLSGSWHRQPCVSPDLRVLLSCCPAASCLPRSASFSRWATAPRWTPRAATPAATHLRCAFFRLSSALLCCALDAPETLPSCARRACICWRARFRGCTSFLGLPGHARPASSRAGTNDGMFCAVRPHHGRLYPRRRHGAVQVHRRTVPVQLGRPLYREHLQRRLSCARSCRHVIWPRMSVGED